MPNDDEKPRDNRPYLTGHRPLETFAQLVARVNANSFLMDELKTTGHSEKPRKRDTVKRTKKKQDVVAMAEKLTTEQLSQLLEKL